MGTAEVMAGKPLFEYTKQTTELNMSFFMSFSQWILTRLPKK
jgi:hypothetical protein